MTTPRERAIAVARKVLEPAADEAAKAGAVLAVNLGHLVDRIAEVLDVDELKLPRHRPDEEVAAAYLLGPTGDGAPPGQQTNLYALFTTRPGQIDLTAIHASGMQAAVAGHGLTVASAPCQVGQVELFARHLLAGCNHARALRDQVPAGRG